MNPAHAIIQRNVKDHMEKSFIDYSMSVIIDRAIPDVRDGLKPVHRRILFAMHVAGNEWNKAYKKSARMVGDVIGKYHPHGDTSVYDAAVRMAQPFSMQHPLIDGQGNFGSVDGDSPAAMRYTEARLSRLSSEMFKDLDPSIVDYRENYDGSEREPVVLPSPYPNLLVNGGEGIAVGMASMIPPHNLREVINATLALMDNPELPIIDLLKHIQAPDFPTGAMVYGLDGFVDAIETGRGSVRMRALWHTEQRKRGESLIVDAIPYQVNKAKLITKIASLVKEGKVDGIVALRDESDREGMRIVIDLRQGESPEVMFSTLASQTELENNFSYNMTVIHQGTPIVMGLRQVMVSWIAFREKVILKRLQLERSKLAAKLHLFAGYMKALGALDQVIEIIRGSEDTASARQNLKDVINVDDIQVQAILDLRLQKLTGMELEGIQSEHQALTNRIQALSATIDDAEAIRTLLRQELMEIKDRYGVDRRTMIGVDVSELSREDLVPREDVVIMMTKEGYIKRLPAKAFNVQNRGTRGKRSIDIGDNDEVVSLHHCSSHDILMVFTEDGQVFSGKAWRIPEGSMTTKGRHIRNVIEGLGSEVNTMLAIPEKDPKFSVLTITQNGQVKRSDIADYAGASRKGGIKGVGLEGDDRLIGAFVCQNGDHLMMAASNGKAIRFPVDNVRIMGRTAGGVRGMMINVEEGEKILGAYTLNQRDEQPLDNDRFLLCVGEKGVGKRTPVSDFPVQNRAGQGVMAFKESPKTGKLIAAIGVSSDKDIILLSSNGVSNRIKVSDIRETMRNTSGVHLINIDDQCRLTQVVSVVAENEEDKIKENVTDE